MGKITVFDHVTIDGFFAGPKGEIDWFKETSPKLLEARAFKNGIAVLRYGPA